MNRGDQAESFGFFDEQEEGASSEDGFGFFDENNETDQVTEEKIESAEGFGFFEEETTKDQETLVTKNTQTASKEVQEKEQGFWAF